MNHLDWTTYSPGKTSVESSIGAKLMKATNAAPPTVTATKYRLTKSATT